MRFKTVTAGLVATLVALLVCGAAGCGGSEELAGIPPLPAVAARVNPDLGPETRPLSAGPGDKSSPSWGPRGDRVAFIQDGYVVDRPVEGGETRPRTTIDFTAAEMAWNPDGALTVLGDAGGGSVGTESLYRASSGGSLAVQKVAPRVLAIGPGPGEGELVAAVRTGPRESGIALLRDGKIERVYTGAIEGTVTGLSPAPDGREIALSVKMAGENRAYELRAFGLEEGDQRRITRLAEGVEILGAPQWTEAGILFVAGSSVRDGEPLYALYHAGPDPGEPEPAPGVGEDFVAGGIRVSPEGGRLAVVGRLNPKAPVNLYVLDLDTGDFAAVTTNEDMDIKTGPDDLAWAPDGDSVAFVARGASTGEPQVRAAPAEELLDDFYNLYEVPVDVPRGVGTGR